jgi:hypothetical protein
MHQKLAVSRISMTNCAKWQATSSKNPSRPTRRSICCRTKSSPPSFTCFRRSAILSLAVSPILPSTTNRSAKKKSVIWKRPGNGSRITNPSPTKKYSPSSVSLSKISNAWAADPNESERHKHSSLTSPHSAGQLLADAHASRHERGNGTRKSGSCALRNYELQGQLS